MENVTKKYRKYVTTTMVVGDSQCKHLFNHFDPGRKGTPAFVSKSGATIEGMSRLLEFVPHTVTTLILHVGTNDIAKGPADAAFERYKKLLVAIRQALPNVRAIYATLVLPRSQNRRRRNLNQPFVTRCNLEAGKFNNLLRKHCRQVKGLFYLDHELQWIPPVRALAADGLHPSFEGVAIMASHLQQLLRRELRRAPPTWLNEPVTSSAGQLQPAARRPPTPLLSANIGPPRQTEHANDSMKAPDQPHLHDCTRPRAVSALTTPTSDRRCCADWRDTALNLRRHTRTSSRPTSPTDYLPPQVNSLLT
ncbi:hypothetical protein HPB48_026041 [Haemaphysalis longicornis]|uniref:SGNH hydrolase-type esterase domain-containing protein n=1 Tax=Haemaphysalis longicornis TaxID=44386 RepID=A0A9J6HB25_HAELO|nr:hypothetical protein HPB48_026041 [Haemaphysalis longicornis]